MKIAIVTSGHKPDDERVYHREIKSLLKTGYKILYCTRWDGELDLSDENLTHINYPRSTTPLKEYNQILLDTIVQEGNIKILHLHEFDTLPLAKLAKKKYGIKIIYDVHDTLRAMWDTFSSKKGFIKKIINKSLSFFETSHLMYVDEVILANKVFGENFYDKKGLHTTVIENFPLPENIDKKKTCSKTPLILYQGQISSDRGILILIDAFEKVRKIIPNASLKIIGALRSGVFHDILHDKIAQSTVGNAIELLSEIPHHEMWEHMYEAHIGVIPSLETPRVMADTPTKLFEYMASGCAVVATDLPPVRYFLERSGELVKPDSSESLAEGMINILMDKTLFRRYVDESKNAINNRYNWKIPEVKMLEVYQKINT